MPSNRAVSEAAKLLAQFNTWTNDDGEYHLPRWRILRERKNPPGRRGEVFSIYQVWFDIGDEGELLEGAGSQLYATLSAADVRAIRADSRFYVTGGEIRLHGTPSSPVFPEGVS